MKARLISKGAAYFLRRAAWLLPIAIPLTCFSQTASFRQRVRVEVRVATSTDHKDLAKTSADQVTQYKTLKIQLSGKSSDPENRVVRWTAFGRNLRSNEITTLDTAEVKLALDGSGRQEVESKRISTTYTPEHSVVTSTRSRGRSLPRAKRVEAEGAKFIGYTVKVLDGGAVVGEYSDPPGFDGKK